MMTLKQFAKGIESIPTSTSWYLADLGEARGKQELFKNQAPQKLKVLREHALIESAVSSNRIEGVELDAKRTGTVVFGRKLLTDRNEEEVRGYRKALDLIHSKSVSLPISEETILQLHRLSRGDVWDAGKYKEKDGDIIEKYPDGRERVRFHPVPSDQTPDAMRELVKMWSDGMKESWVHPLILAAGFNLDFLCVHPFRDGNGRVSRLLLLLELYHLGFEVGRYISIERIIEENKERYYETLEESSKGWHEGKHNPWHYTNFILSIVKLAYKEFEEQLSRVAKPRGAKTQRVLSVLANLDKPFRIVDLQRKVPGVGVDMIRRVLKELRDQGKVKCLGKGKYAEWERIKKL
jgi:Fic family protein